MRQISVKYLGECRKCGATLQVGAAAVYERHVGIFCPACAPTDTEEIRALRTEAGERRAEKYDDWADRREMKAAAQLNSHPEIRHDWAFITQPGHIPFRDRMNRADGRAYESLQTAERFRDKAKSLRHVRVAGDAAKRDEARREAVRAWIKPGMMVDTCHCGIRKVFKVNKKTATIEGQFGKFTHDLMFLSQPRAL